MASVEEYYETMGVVHVEGKCPICTNLEDFA